MAKIQAYVSDDVVNKINAIVEQRRAEGARKEDVSSSSVISMLVELGLRVYEAQMERKESPFNQMLFNTRTQVVIDNLTCYTRNGLFACRINLCQYHLIKQ